jgi:hypothetical protein
MAQPSHPYSENNANVRTSKEQEGDYIDFEEVKE